MVEEYFIMFKSCKQRLHMVTGKIKMAVDRVEVSISIPSLLSFSVVLLDGDTQFSDSRWHD